MLVGTGHAYYWQQQGAPPVSTDRQGTHHAILGGSDPTQSIKGFIIRAVWIGFVLYSIGGFLS